MLAWRARDASFMLFFVLWGQYWACHLVLLSMSFKAERSVSKDDKYGA